MMQSVLGLMVFILAAWLLSENRKGVRPRVVIVGIGLQILVALVMLIGANLARMVREYRHYGTHIALAIGGALLFFVGIALVTKIG